MKCLIEVLESALLNGILTRYPDTISVEIVLLNEGMNGKLIYDVPTHLCLDLFILLNG